MDSTNAPEYLSIRDVSVRLGVHEHTVENWLKSGHLRGYKFGGLWRIKWSDVEAMSVPNCEPGKDG